MTGPGYLMLIEWPEKGGVAVPPADLILQLDYVERCARRRLERRQRTWAERWLASWQSTLA